MIPATALLINVSNPDPNPSFPNNFLPAASAISNARANPVKNEPIPNPANAIPPVSFKPATGNAVVIPATTPAIDTNAVLVESSNPPIAFKPVAMLPAWVAKVAPSNPVKSPAAATPAINPPIPKPAKPIPTAALPATNSPPGAAAINPPLSAIAPNIAIEVSDKLPSSLIPATIFFDWSENVSPSNPVKSPAAATPAIKPPIPKPTAVIPTAALPTVVIPEKLDNSAPAANIDPIIVIALSFRVESSFIPATKFSACFGKASKSKPAKSIPSEARESPAIKPPNPNPTAAIPIGALTNPVIPENFDNKTPPASNPPIIATALLSILANSFIPSAIFLACSGKFSPVKLKLPTPVIAAMKPASPAPTAAIPTPNPNPPLNLPPPPELVSDELA